MKDFKKFQKLVITEKCNHGDTKTVIAKPHDYPPLEKGDIVIFIKEWTNLYGTWQRVKASSGQTYDIKKNKVKIKSKKKYHTSKNVE